MFLDKTFDEMAKKNKLAVGIDLRNDVTQISYCAMNQSIPETFSMVAGQEAFDIPTLLCKKNSDAQTGVTYEKWLFGKEAIDTAQKREGILVEDLVLLAKAQTAITVGEKDYEPAALFEIFLKKCLLLIAPQSRLEDIISIAFTLKEADANVIACLKQAVAHLQKEMTQVHFMTYEDCFFQYLIHQPMEMWTQDVILYHYRKDGLMSYYLQMNRNIHPSVCFIEKQFFPQMKMTDISTFSNEQRDAYLAQLDEALMEINHTLCDGKHLTCAFLLGELFASGWCKQSIKYLCHMGRVFQGTNLFSKGACYGARERQMPSSLTKEYCYLAQDKLKQNIGIMANYLGEDMTKTLLFAGMNWYEAVADLDIILLKDRTISLVIAPIDGSQTKIADITLEGFQSRGNRTNRLGIHLEMSDQETIQVEIRDRGFGEFFPSTGKIWRESFSLN